jgi:membrane fusion protein (multidrug efflux system)
MTKRNKILAGIGAAFVIVGIYLAYEHFMYVTTDNAQVEAHAVMLAAKVPGYVTAVNVREGQKVNKGDVLAEIDSRDYQNLLTQAKGELTSVEARKRDAERNYNRMNDLFAKGVVSRQQYDTANASYSEVKAKYDAIAAQVAQAELNLENTKIKAPSNGFIARKSVEVGQLAAAGVPLIGFVDAGERWIIANFKETEIAGIALGHKVEVDVDAIPGKSFHGSVVAISAATGATFTLLPPDNATGNFTKVVQRVPVRIQLTELSDSEVELLRAGLSAFVKVSKH